MPPSLAEWLPEDHFAWFVLGAVEAMDLSGCSTSTRGSVFDPAVAAAGLTDGVDRPNLATDVVWLLTTVPAERHRPAPVDGDTPLSVGEC
jgi:hypothetical protein